MKVVIMAGGKGTRLMPLTQNIPKPMVNLIDRPVLEHILTHLKDQGFSDITITLGYLPNVITDYFGNGEKLGLDIKYSVEETPLGTAGGVKRAAENFNEDFLVVSGDAYSEIDFKKAVDFHKSKRSTATIVVQPHPSPSSFGVVDTDFDNRITEFIEKPDISRPALINTGIYILSPSIVKLIPDGVYDFGKDLFPKLVQIAYAYVDYSYWSDIGTLPSFYETNKYLAEKMLVDKKKSLVMS